MRRDPKSRSRDPMPRSATGALALDADWALHRPCATPWAPCMQQRQAAFVPFAGTEDLSRSHFETQDSIELGQPLGGLAQLTVPAFSAACPTRCRSGRRRTAHRLHRRAAARLRGRRHRAEPLPARASASRPSTSARRRYCATCTPAITWSPRSATAWSCARRWRRQCAEEMKAANRDAINTKGFELEAERMGRLMRDKYRIGFIDVGGWDTHVGEGGAQGTLATNLAEPRPRPAGVLAVPGRRMEQHRRGGAVGIRPHLPRKRQPRHRPRAWHRVLDIGRRHQRRQHRRRTAAVGRGTLFQDRDFPVLNDYRAVLGGLFRTLWGLSSEQSGQIFPQTRPLDLKLV